MTSISPALPHEVARALALYVPAGRVVYVTIRWRGREGVALLLGAMASGRIRVRPWVPSRSRYARERTVPASLVKRIASKDDLTRRHVEAPTPPRAVTELMRGLAPRPLPSQRSA